MPVSNKPLFSPPILAAVMVLCTLAIWLLNLTAPSSKLPTPSLEKWQTTSNIPVSWVRHDNWEKGDKLEIRFVFRSDETNIRLVQTTLAMLMSNSLPISTASINQRLSPLAAQVNSYYDHESQVIGLTLSNQSQYLNPTLALVTNWLKQPDFKLRTFEQWKRQQKNTALSKHTMQNALFNSQSTTERDAKPNNTTLGELDSLELKDIKDYYHELLSSASHIYIVGDLPAPIKPSVEEALNKITHNYQLTDDTPEATHYSARRITELNKQTNNELWQSHSAIALTPFSSAKDWLSVQIWAADLVSTLNSQANIDFVQLNMALSAQRPWAGWNVQYAENLMMSPITGKSEQGENVQGETAQTQKALFADSFIAAENIPSLNERARFADLFNQLKDQLEQQAQSVTWWSYLATQVVHEGSPLSLEEFIESYKDAIDTFTIDDYTNAISKLIKADTYQEIQSYQ